MGFRYGARSRACLDTVDPRLVAVFETAIEVVDLAILQGWRSKEEQEALFLAEKSKLVWPNSRHNSALPPSADEFVPVHAVDSAPWPIDWNDIERFRAVAFLLRGIGEAQGTPLRLGADWDGDFSFRDQTFHDVGHVEMVTP